MIQADQEAAERSSSSKRGSREEMLTSFVFVAEAALDLCSDVLHLQGWVDSKNGVLFERLLDNQQRLNTDR